MRKAKHLLPVLLLGLALPAVTLADDDSSSTAPQPAPAQTTVQQAPADGSYGPGMMGGAPGYGMGPGYGGMSPGMMGNYYGQQPGSGNASPCGPGMMANGYGQQPQSGGQGMSPCYGSGMMGNGYGPQSQGSGQAGAPSYGPGMMYDQRGYGAGYGRGMGSPMGSGMGMLGPVWSLNLTDAQRNSIIGLMQKQQQEQFQLMNRMMAESNKLQQLYSKPQWDAKAIGEEYGRIFDMRKQAIVSMIETRNKVLGLLTDEQRKELEQYGYGYRR